MAKAVHMMVRVLNEARSIDFYTKCFGLKIVDRREWPDFILIYLSNSENTFEIELTVNKGRTAPYELGAGYGHLAFVVENISLERERILKLGYAPKEIKEMKHEGKHFGRFFFLEDPDGYKIEVLERGGRFA